MTRLTLPPTVRQPQPKQTKAQRDAVYAYVTARDVTCRVWSIDAEPWQLADCEGRLERHHAGVGIGSNRNDLTDARHVVLLCKFHHDTWAPSHSRLILEWLARVEDARERARHDADEDARELLIEKLRGEAREEGNEE